MSLCVPLIRLPNAFVGMLGYVFAATLAACGGGAPIPSPPSPNMAQLDPELRSAVEAARARVLADPDDLGAWGELAMVLEANELDGPAEEAWTHVVTVAAPDARWWYSLARVRERRGDVPGALAALERTLALADDYAPAHGRHGRLLLEAGRLDEAEAALARALALDDRLPSAALGMARLQLLRGEAERAVATLTPLLARFPREPYVNGLLARAFTALGDAARAEQHLRAEEQAGAPSANDPWLAEVQRRACGRRVRLERVKARLFAGDAKAAWEELAPLEGESSDPLVLGMQCQVLLALGRPEEVLARLERAGERAETSSFLVLDRALALRALGEPDTATGGHWLSLALQGTRSNRDGVGARIAVVVTTPAGARTIHRAAGAVSSFGGSTHRLEIGLGDATRIQRLEIRWPRTSAPQVFTDVPLDAWIAVEEGATELVRRERRSFRF